MTSPSADEPVEEPIRPLDPTPSLSQDEEAELLNLVELGRQTRTVDVLGHRVVLSSLTVDDELQVGQVVKPYIGTIAQARAHRTGLLAAAVREIDGVPLWSPLRVSDRQNDVAKKFERLSEYHAAVIDTMYERYIEFEQEVGKVFTERLGESAG